MLRCSIPDEKAQKALKGVMMWAGTARLPPAWKRTAMTPSGHGLRALLVGSRPRAGPGMERARAARRQRHHLHRAEP